MLRTIERLFAKLVRKYISLCRDNNICLMLLELSSNVAQQSGEIIVFERKKLALRLMYVINTNSFNSVHLITNFDAAHIRENIYLETK